MSAELVVLIATAGRAKLLARTLNSLAQCQLPTQYRETIVVENGSKGRAETIVRDADDRLRARYLHVAEANKSRALNTVLQQLDDCLIFFTDDDTRIEPATLAHYAQAAGETGPGTYFGGPLAVDYEQTPPQWLQSYLPNSASGMSYGTKRRRVTRSLFLGANWAAFSSDLKANDGFDTRKGPGSTANSVGQETDMQRRLLSNGLSGLYIPEAVVWHYVPQARCSRNWALNRAYRQGVSWGLRGSHQDALPQHSRMRRARNLFTNMLWFMVTRFSSSTRVRFSGERRLRWNRGYIHGDNISISRSGMNDMAVHQPSDSKSPGIRIMPDTQYSSNPSSGAQGDSSKPDMVVVIATAGRPVLLGRTLDSLASCRLPAGYRETIVVENGPKCGAEDIVRRAKPVLRARYMYEPQGNKSQALNRVLRDLGDAFIFFTDDDTRIESEALACYWEAARQMGAGLFYGGPIGVDYEREPVEWLKTYLPNSARGWELGQSTRRVRTAKFLGFNWAAFAADLRANDGFDCRKGPGSPTNSVGQETDMQQRLLKAGMCGVYLPGAFVWHYVPESRCTSEWTLERSFRNGVCGGINATRIQGSFIRSRGRDLLKLIHHAGWFFTTRFSRRPDIRFRGDYMKRWIEGYRHGRGILEDTPPANTGSKAA